MSKSKKNVPASKSTQTSQASTMLLGITVVFGLVGSYAIGIELPGPYLATKSSAFGRQLRSNTCFRRGRHRDQRPNSCTPNQGRSGLVSYSMKSRLLTPSLTERQPALLANE